MNGVELIEVIRTELTSRGKGTEDDPCRRVTQYWSKEGELLAEVDPCEKYFNVEKERDKFYETLLAEVCKECKTMKKKGK